MPFFPQLPSGTAVQYPIQKRRIQRTIVNDCQDGRQIRLADTGATSVRWDLQYESLSDAEIRTPINSFNLPSEMEQVDAKAK